MSNSKDRTDKQNIFETVTHSDGTLSLVRPMDVATKRGKKYLCDYKPSGDGDEIRTLVYRRLDRRIADQFVAGNRVEFITEYTLPLRILGAHEQKMVYKDLARLNDTYYSEWDVIFDRANKDYSSKLEVGFMGPSFVSLKADSIKSRTMLNKEGVVDSLYRGLAGFMNIA